MNTADLGLFQELLREKKESLMEWFSEASLDRPDSAPDIESLREALERIERNAGVPCQRCDGEVEHEVLLSSPATSICLACMNVGDLRRLEDDLRVTREIDRSLLPRRVPSTGAFQFGIHYQPSHLLSGDFYDFQGFPDSGKLALVVGDVAGKGIPAGLLRSTFQATVRALAHQGLPPAKLLTITNRRLLDTAHPGRYASLFYGELDVSTGRLSYANGGHHPPILLRASGKIDVLGPTGTVVGIIPEACFENDLATLEPGDLLALYTDGITDAESASGSPFGEEGLVELLERSSDDPAQVIAERVGAEVERFAPGERSDDRTVVVVKRGGQASV